MRRVTVTGDMQPKGDVPVVPFAPMIVPMYGDDYFVTPAEGIVLARMGQSETHQEGRITLLLFQEASKVGLGHQMGADRARRFGLELIQQADAIEAEAAACAASAIKRAGGGQ